MIRRGRLLIVEFLVEGKPATKQRPRHTKSGFTYTPPETRAAEKAVRDTFLETIDSSFSVPFEKEFDLRLEVEAFMPDLRARDWDNVGKLVSDALNKVAYRDDSQIKEAEVTISLDRKNPRTLTRLFVLTEVD